MLKGNKGEWSEIYVFLKLLSEGKLNAADSDLNEIVNVFYPIVKILRIETGTNYEYSIADKNIIIVNGNTNCEIASVPISEFAENAKELFKGIKQSTTTTFEFEEINSFLDKILVSSLKAKSKEKRDITLIVHDLNTGLKPTLGFSIKSNLGGNSTLLNAGKGTNFIYEVQNSNLLLKDEIARINELNSFSEKIQKIEENGCKLIFLKVESEKFEHNLKLINSSLPLIISDFLYEKFKGKSLSRLTDLIRIVSAKNPVGYELSFGHPFYEYKIKAFLTDVALGMTPSTIWRGTYDATGGIIIVKEDGGIVCYHIYNRNEFQEYLINNTILDTASTSRHEFGKLEELEGKLCFKLNLQVRFN